MQYGGSVQHSASRGVATSPERSPPRLSPQIDRGKSGRVKLRPRGVGVGQSAQSESVDRADGAGSSPVPPKLTRAVEQEPLGCAGHTCREGRAGASGAYPGADLALLTDLRVLRVSRDGRRQETLVRAP